MNTAELELFQPDGHLKEWGLLALAEGRLEGELQRLEAAEHLGFCDDCLLRYTALLSNEVLLQPQASLLVCVGRRQRRRKLRLAVARYATVAAAAALAVAMWGAGSGMLARWGGSATAAQAGPAASAAVNTTSAQPGPGWGARISEGLDSVAAGLDNFFGNLAAPCSAPQRDDRIREEHEKLFEQDR